MSATARFLYDDCVSTAVQCKQFEGIKQIN